jgi:two-component system sensor histidine kinase/response regulator
MGSTAALPTFEIAGQRILVIDEGAADLATLATVLRAEGCLVAEVACAGQGWAAAREFRPDLILLAGATAGPDAGDFRSLIRRLHEDSGAPILLLEEHGGAEDAAGGLAARVVDVLAKPLRAREVAARIRPHLHGRDLAKRLVRAEAAGSRLLGMAAHDLRGPLATIRGIAEFLRDGAVGPLSPNQRELVGMIYSAGGQMPALVNELLDVAMIEAGEFQLALAPCDLPALIGESVALATLEAEKRKIRVSFRPPAEAAIVALDAAKMRQIIGNLLSNAVKYSPPGSIVSVLALRDLAAGTGGFCVRDRGPGIPAGEHGKSFKDFGRLSVRPTGGGKTPDSVSSSAGRSSRRTAA